MSDIPKDRRQLRYAHLLKQLRRAAGIGGTALATLGSGPCGSCWVDTYQQCYAKSDLNAWRESHNVAPSDECPDLVEFSRYAQEHRLAQPYDRALPDAGIVGATYDPDTCCYLYESKSCAGGRPFLVNASPCIAHLESTDGGGSPVDDCTRKWLHDAAVEHASVAAFARLSLELLHHGAPAELLARVHAASLDELRHAQVCKRWAETASGRSWNFAPLPVANALSDLSLDGVLARNIVEGCIGETIAACIVRERALWAADAGITADLHQIADDEASHAELAFSILAWVLKAHPEMHGRAIATFLANLDAIERAPTPDRDSDVDRTSGHIPEHAAHAVMLDACSRILRPLVLELQAATSPSGLSHSQYVTC